MQALLFAALLANARAHVDGDRFFAPVAGDAAGAAAVPAVRRRARDRRGARGAGARRVQRAAAARGLRGRSSPRRAALAACTWSGRCGRTAILPIVFISATSRGGSTRCSALRAPPARPRSGFASRAVQAVRGRGPVDACRRDRGRCVVLALYALVFRHPGGKLAAARRVRAADVHELLSHAAGARRRARRLRARRAPRRSGAIRRSSSTVTIFCCFFFYKIRIVPEHFWMTRRFLPVILPGALLFAAAAALDRIARRLERRGRRRGRSSASCSSRCSRCTTRAPAGRCSTTSSTRA